MENRVMTPNICKETNSASGGEFGEKEGGWWAAKEEEEMSDGWFGEEGRKMVEEV